MTEAATAIPVDVDRFRHVLRTWITTHAEDLQPFRGDVPLDVPDRIKQGARLITLLDQHGWTRVGWPSEVGGTGGDARLRGVPYDELSVAGISVPEVLWVLETVGAAVIRFAPELAAEHLPKYFSGSEFWCQGFSEPDAGSDLASLRTRAQRLDDGSFVVSGQKIWSSFGAVADKMVTLVRTGTLESRHKGLTMFLIDLEAPGVTRRPIRMATGDEELSEVFFDEVHVPASRLIGDVDGGWAVAMYLLQFERGMYAWMRQAHLHGQMVAMIRRTPTTERSALRTIGDAHVAHRALRAQTWRTLGRLADGESPGPEISVDKILLATAEQRVLDAARLMNPRSFVLGDDADAKHLRSEWFYTRAASIYGGSAEVQRSIIADHVLGLPKEIKT